MKKHIHRLGRKAPSDFDHVAKYPLTARMAVTMKPQPVIVGANWYDAFDNPVKDKDGKYWVGKNPKSLGGIRGGHCVCMPHLTTSDTYGWYDFYNQGNEGACVGFGTSRAMSLLNRKRYNARWLWDLAKLNDEFADTMPGDDNGTTVRAAMDVLRGKGHVPWKTSMASLTWQKRDQLAAIEADGVLANRWATNIDDLFSVLENDTYKKLGAIPFLNSWGRTYPHITWVPCETWDRLLKEDGEMTMMTDK
jgi:hypothetical protein